MQPLFEKTIIKVKRSEFIASEAKPELRQGFYGIMTSDVMNNDILVDGEKILYTLITSLCHVKGYCWAINAFFEEILGKSDRTIRRFLESLTDNGFISIEYIVDEDTEEILERRIYPIFNVELFRRLAKNSIIGQKE